MVEAVEKTNRDYALRGPAASYFLCDKREALLEGGTRCGKSFAWLIKAREVATQYPGSRQLIVRQTRKSLNESVLRDWREEILWTGHESISGTASREHQDRYTWRNGSEVFFAGMENARDTTNPILSTKWDRIYWCQLEESSSPADWELLATRLSNFKTPYHQLTGDVNPAAPSHWVNMRFAPENLGETRARFPFRHYDNPSFYVGHFPNGEWTREGAEYMSILESTLTGVRRDRFLLSKWVAAEGQILENWDPRIHSIDGQLAHEAGLGWVIHAPTITGNSQPIKVAYFTCGVDWGWKPDPGVMQLWAYDSPRWHPHVRRFRVAEVMRLEWQKEEWADLACEWHEKYGVRYFSCDPADPEARQHFNIRIGKKHRRAMPQVAVPCPPIGGGHRRSKHHAGMIDLMRDGLGGPQGHVRSYFLKDAFPLGIDDGMRKAGRPTCFESEVESWVYAVDPHGQATTKPDDKCDQHAIMAAGYDETLNYVRGFGQSVDVRPRLVPGSDDAELFRFMQEREAEKRKQKRRKKPWD